MMRILALAAALLGLAAGESRVLDDGLRGWTGEARQRLDAFVLAGAQPGRPPVAAFDWDNTVFKNDMGDATLFWMLRHDKIRQPAGRDWGLSNPRLTGAARKALGAACDALAAPGDPLPTSTGAACADEILAIYDGGKTTGGAEAFREATTPTQHQAYAWAAQLQAGYRPDDIRDFAAKAYEEANSAPVGATQRVGTRGNVTAWGRIYPQMADLIGALRSGGFDIWIVSASPQYVIEPVAGLVGVDADHVIGIRQVLHGGRITAAFQGCGGFPDGFDAPITFDRGKRCWLGKVVFGMPDGPGQLRVNPDPNKRPVFAAGDSDTDRAFMQDATGLKLAINRNKAQLMCDAYGDAGGRWIVQPMFLEPKPRKAGGYACSRTVDHAGEPLRDETGQIIADQEDRVFALGE